MRILLIEDEAGISNFVKQGLEEEAFAVDIADNGLAGLQMANSEFYDLLLVDWMLPGITGIEVCKEFRKKNKRTPIIFLTAKDTLEDIVQGLEAGADDYLKKPFHFDELLARVKVQARKQNEDLEILSFGDIKLDVTAHQVFQADEEITLTKTEFSLLEYLLRNKGRVCSRKEIIEQVWNIHFDYDTGIIDVYMNSLRKKLELTKDQNHIQTIRGVGYIAKD